MDGGNRKSTKFIIFIICNGGGWGEDRREGVNCMCVCVCVCVSVC